MPVPINERGYPHPELLTDTEWLAGALTDASVRIVDARTDKDYASGHIPGAINISGFSLGRVLPGPDVTGPEGFAELVGPLGIDESTPVVVYDDGGRAQMSQMAGMTAWTFLYFGHPNVRYLDGGLEKWTDEGRPLETDKATHEARTFSAQPSEAVYCSLDQAKAFVADDDAILWDVRAIEEFDGTKAGFRPPPRLGHMPGAVQLNYTELFDADSGTIKPAGELATLIGKKGITPESTVATY